MRFFLNLRSTGFDVAGVSGAFLAVSAWAARLLLWFHPAYSGDPAHGRLLRVSRQQLHIAGTAELRRRRSELDESDSARRDGVHVVAPHHGSHIEAYAGVSRRSPYIGYSRKTFW